ncbi:MAG: hypothetical protein LC770_06930 [Acidobacteria bacterium]|nr:hypothetical protein [Acidobacteriota bacterium]
MFELGTQNSELIELRIIGIIFGIVVAAIGGVIAYRALFLEPSSAVVITETEVRELPNTFRVVGGIAMLAIGATVALLSSRRRNR